MLIVSNVEKLIPATDDVYTDDLSNFFLTVANLVSNEFMDITIEVEQLEFLTSECLKKYTTHTKVS